MVCKSLSIFIPWGRMDRSSNHGQDGWWFRILCILIEFVLPKLWMFWSVDTSMLWRNRFRVFFTKPVCDSRHTKAKGRIHIRCYYRERTYVGGRVVRAGGSVPWIHGTHQVTNPARLVTGTPRFINSCYNFPTDCVVLAFTSAPVRTARQSICSSLWIPQSGYDAHARWSKLERLLCRSTLPFYDE